MERIEKTLKLYTHHRKNAINWADKMQKLGYNVSMSALNEASLTYPYGINTIVEATIIEKFKPLK